jgi:hypothetical protein
MKILKLGSQPRILTNIPSDFLQLREHAAALTRKIIHDLKTARHFVMCVIKTFTTKLEKFQLRGNNSMCAGAFHLLRGRTPA